jgi:DNA ligase D-like protein (predicted 3'-phosphoesterase)
MSVQQSMTRKTFIVHEHQARTHHFDFRLEKDGVLKSWAVPKGVPEEPGTKRLAIQVEDHPLEYGDFEGTIPQGQYGAGTVRIWDRGTYDLHEWIHAKIVFTLHGARLEGNYSLVRFKSGGAHDWLLIKRKE